MAYIGQEPVNTFSPVPSKDSFTGDGSTTTFDLQNKVVNDEQQHERAQANANVFSRSLFYWTHRQEQARSQP